MTKESLKSSAFILRCLNYAESDLIVTFYSRDFGKIKGMAKGAKKSKKRFVNVFEPFSLTKIIFSHQKSDSLAFIESCEIIDHYSNIRGDLEKTLIASYFVDLTDNFSPEGKANTNVFELLQNFLLLLSNEAATESTLRFFEMHLLKLTGFEPTLDHCIRCKIPITNGTSYYFYPREGGIKCAACARPERYDLPISAGTVRTLLLGKDMDVEKIKLITLSDSLAMECRSILTGFITHVLRREVKSFHVLEQVRKMNFSKT